MHWIWLLIDRNEFVCIKATMQIEENFGTIAQPRKPQASA